MDPAERLHVGYLARGEADLQPMVRSRLHLARRTPARPVPQSGWPSTPSAVCSCAVSIASAGWIRNQATYSAMLGDSTPRQRELRRSRESPIRKGVRCFEKILELALIVACTLAFGLQQ